MGKTEQTLADTVASHITMYPRFCEATGFKPSIRYYMWNLFASIVGEHVQMYTVPQYGDYPDDNVANWSSDDCLKQIQKYANRFFSNSRGDAERKKDLLKVAHYASLAYLKECDLESRFQCLSSTMAA